MKQNYPSLTAYRVAVMRAAHQVVDSPKVFDDPIALNIVGPQGDSEIHSEKQKFKTRFHSYLRASVVARSRLAEDELSVTVQRGVRQYVILGAGLDTFAYRNPHSSVGLNVFEVDYPATQEWKRRQLEAAGIAMPGNLNFAPVDFENQVVTEALQNAGFKKDEPSFFAWLGVTMYLTCETVMDTIKQIAAVMPPGSGILFDYVVPPWTQKFFHRLVFRLMARSLSRVGEPWKSFFDPVSLVTDLKAMGFSHVVDIGPEEINARLFNDRRDLLRVGNFGHVMNAQV